MRFDIDQQLVNQTTDCVNDLVCLSGKEESLCKIKFYDGKRLLTECLEEGYCPYKRIFNFVKFCNCPVRIEIFKKYKI